MTINCPNSPAQKHSATNTKSRNGKGKKRNKLTGYIPPQSSKKRNKLTSCIPSQSSQELHNASSIEKQFSHTYHASALQPFGQLDHPAQN